MLPLNDQILVSLRKGEWSHETLESLPDGLHQKIGMLIRNQLPNAMCGVLELWCGSYFRMEMSLGKRWGEKLVGKFDWKKKNNYKQQKESFESLKQKIHNNVRLPKPSKCSQIIYESLILPCWKLKISERPTIRVQKRKPTKKWDHVNLIFVSNFQNILSVFESVDIIRKILDIEDVAKVKDSDLSEDKSVKLKSSIEYEIAENNSYSRLKSDWVLYDESDTRPKNVTAPNLGYAKQIRRPKSNFKH